MKFTINPPMVIRVKTMRFMRESVHWYGKCAITHRMLECHSLLVRLFGTGVVLVILSVRNHGNRIHGSHCEPIM